MSARCTAWIWALVRMHARARATGQPTRGLTSCTWHWGSGAGASSLLIRLPLHT